jgi:hypothetical protein
VSGFWIHDESASESEDGREEHTSKTDRVGLPHLEEGLNWMRWNGRLLIGYNMKIGSRRPLGWLLA